MPIGSDQLINNNKKDISFSANPICKQPNSRMCFICGVKNIGGVKVSFYELQNGHLEGRFAAREIHQGYPGRIHGGVISGILDETIGRTIKMLEGHEDLWGITVDLRIQFFHPLPTGKNLTARASIVKNSKRYFEGKGKIYLPDGTSAVEATGSYMKFSAKEIDNFDLVREEWQVIGD